MNTSDFYNAPTYRDAGCPSQCMSENSYSALSGVDQCAMNELGDYTSPFANKNTPSYCNFLDNYSRVGNIYAPSTIYIPPESAARIYHYPIGVNSDFIVTQPQIINFQAQTEFNNLSSSPIIQDPAALMKEIETDINEVRNGEAQLAALRVSIMQIQDAMKTASNEQAIQLANKGIEIAKQARAIYNDLQNKVSMIKTSGQNVAPYTVRDVAKQAKVDSIIKEVLSLQRMAQQSNIAVAAKADLFTNIGKSAATSTSTMGTISAATTIPPTAQMMSPNAKMGIQPFRYLRNRG
jgi:hypothetical protein